MDQNKNICLSNLCYIVTSTEKVKFITFTWWHFWKTFVFAQFTCSKLEEFLQGSFSKSVKLNVVLVILHDTFK